MLIALYSKTDREISRKSGYFLDAPGGTGKTSTIPAIEALLRLSEKTAISIAISAVAESILDRGRTAHSIFKYLFSVFIQFMQHFFGLEARHVNSKCGHHYLGTKL